MVKYNCFRNTTNWRGGEWQSTATEFKLICDRKIINKLLTSIGMGGLFLGALIGGAYAEKFGRKNCIIVRVTKHKNLLSRNFIIESTLLFN